MASTLALRRRIKTARNISKTTRAFQMIAASKLKKAQEATLSSRPYVEKLSILNKNVQISLEKAEISHPYLKNDSKGVLLIAIAPDKGLCGGLVTNLVRELHQRKNLDFELITVGKKIEHPAARLEKTILATFPFGTTLPTFDLVYPIATLIDQEYLSGKVGTVILLTTHFDSLFSQKPKVTTLLPISPLQLKENEEKKEEKEVGLELFEPSPSKILPNLLKHYLEMVLYQHLLESYVSEQAARMVAMQNATDNAKDMIEALTLEYNKARQQKITSEILDITGGSYANEN